MTITKEQIREAGGIVHSDGNIFFTNVQQLEALIAKSAVSEPVEYLANGTRFKTTLLGDGSVRITGLPYELAGRWVAFVAAENDTHLKATSPAEAKRETPPDHVERVLVPLKMTRAMESVFSQEDWEWADVLVAANSVTEDQYEESSNTALPAEKQKPMTHDKIWEIWHGQPKDGAITVTQFARAIEAAHGIVNIGAKE